MPSFSELLTLPGPRSFLRRLVGLIDEGGRQVVLVVPDWVTGSEPLEALEMVLPELHMDRSQRYISLQPEDVASLGFVLAMARALGVEEYSDEVALLTGEHLADTCVLVPLWAAEPAEARRVGALLESVGRATLADPTVPRAVVVAVTDTKHLTQVPADELYVRRHWWWRVLHRLDTQVYVWNESFRRTVDDVQREVIIELAAWDMDTAQWLLTNWDGATVDSAVGCLRDLSYVLSDDAISGEEVGHSFDRLAHVERTTQLGEEPTPELLELWSRGVLLRWDGAIRPRLCAIGDGADLHESVRRAVHHGQTRALMPKLDLWRGMLEEEVRSALSEASLSAFLDNSWNASNRNPAFHLTVTDVLEAPVLVALIESQPSLNHLRDSPAMTLLKRLRQARNSLAHARCLDGDMVGRLLQRHREYTDWKDSITA